MGLWQELMSNRNGARAARARYCRPARRFIRRPDFQPLEPRKLLSAVFEYGVLTIHGTEQADTIQISNEPLTGKVQVSGVDGVADGTTFDGVAFIRVYSYGGSDTIQADGDLRNAIGFPISLEIDAGEGDNRIFTSAGNDVIRAGHGNNLISTGAGDDSISVGGGDNTIYAGDGDDWIAVGAGNNTIDAGSGENFIEVNEDLIAPTASETSTDGDEETQGKGGRKSGSIGFFKNKKGQKLIRSLNGGPDSTELGRWLGENFEEIWGPESAVVDLSQATNAEIADYYKDLFKRKKRDARHQGLSGPAKFDANLLAVAFSVYITNESLAGDIGRDFGFRVTSDGLGAELVNVGRKGAAFGVANHTEMTVMELLQATERMSSMGVAYDVDRDGDANDRLERSYRSMAHSVYQGLKKG